MQGHKRLDQFQRHEEYTKTGQILLNDSNFIPGVNLCCLPLSCECDKVSRAYKLVVME